MSMKSKNLCRFTRELDEKLIELVSKNEVLYNTNHKFYKDIAVRDDVWLAISSIVGKTVQDCKTRWRSLRDLYHRKKKDEKKGKRPRISWEYMEAMSFLESFLSEKERKALREEDPDDIDEDKPLAALASKSTQEVDPPRPQKEDNNHSNPSKKIKVEKPDAYHQFHETSLTLQLLREIRDATRHKQDPVMTFFESMAKTVMTFPAALAAEAKLKVCQIVTEIECRLLDETGAYPENFTNCD
ncbi:uncharacterized protein LOC132701896 [Cylas formicarius]|uniref:uncharacterized protein LOC132701896 n=1 Tax=Cylas formicarius TaxID=197179 RepID=UPI0029584965|nr:uncharacterized protein LOC132701896 [Cylas formicarius]